jgi:N12 class adenine-specific DNA methylase
VDPDYKKYRFNLHEYFFGKSLDKVRPGGLLTFITSRFTMDKVDDKARAYLMDRADLIGAIRLPQTAFKENAGTEVVTDVLFFRKKIPGEETTGKRWSELKEVKTPEGPFHINEYFADHPEMILGKNSGQGSMYGKNEYTVLPLEGNIEEHFANAVENLPGNVYSIARQAPEVQKKAIVERDFNPTNKKEGGLYLSDQGEIMIVESGSGIPLRTAKDIGEHGKSWLKGYLGIRDAVKMSHYDQLNDGPWETSLGDLQRRYKEFVKTYGRVNQYTTYESKEIDEDGNEVKVERRRYKYGHLFKNDIEFPLVTSLEIETETGDIIDGPALSGRTLKKPTPREIRTAPDALAVSLDTIGRLDPEHIGGLLNKPASVVIEQLGDLIYGDPSRDAHILADEYLSGDVVAKLEEARIAAESDPQYQRNVEALIKVQPLPLTPMQVTVNLGAPWVPTEIVTDFAHEILGLPHQTIVTYNPTDNSWEIGISEGEAHGYVRRRRGGRQVLKKQQLRGATSEWSTPQRGSNEIMESVLNNKTIKVTYTDEEKKVHVDVTATAAANDVAKKMKARFKNWVWEDTGRAKELIDLWNSTKNNIAPRKFDGSHLTTPGVTLSWKWHDHQKRVIWRIIQAGNTYINHAVGAGKTAAYIAAGMEMKRMGLISKPIYSVPRSVLQQFANEFQELYPMANIMVADEENFHTENRRRFIAQATLNNPDAIIITHSALGLLRMREENIAPVRDAVLNELRDALADLEESDAGRIRIKQMEKRIDKAQQRFDSMIQKGDNVVTFEDMGADFIFIDEAHLFRKLDFTTNRQAKGIDPVGSQRAMDLYIKTKWLEGQKPGRSYVFGSGTPVTNTIGELYTVMRYFMEEEMEKEGIRHFDAWANIFGEVRTDPEMNAAGRYEMVERFSKFVNVPEMMARVRTFMDVVTMSQLAGLVSRPPIRGGTPEIVITPSSDALKKYQREELQPRIETSRAWKPSKDQPGNPDPLINIITDGRLASIDMRFVRSVPNDPNSKLNRWIDGIIEGYKETASNDYLDESGKPSGVKGAAQICFYNLGFGSSVAQRRGFDARAWVTKRFREEGIPLKEVAWFDDYNQPGKKDAKNAMVKELRNGTKRILIGSAKTMGVGLNVQRRLAQEHYLDPPWYPADVEQPDGRILRQGNQNREVVMKRYATKGSYDGTQWQMVARKSKAIEDAFLGENVRELEDISESSQYEMASALASGDERAIRVAGLKGEIENLRNLQSAHYGSQRQLEYDKSSNESAIKYQRKRIKELEEAETKVPEYVSDITGKVGNKTYTDKREFGEAIIQAYKAQMANSERGNESKKIGEINDLPLFFRTWGEGRVGTSGYHQALNLRITPNVDYDIEEGEMWIADPNLSPGGLVRKLVNKLNGLSSETSTHEGQLREYEDSQKKVLARLGIPFPMAQELNQKISELAQLEGELLSESAAATAADAAQRKAEGRQTEADVAKEAREALQKRKNKKTAEGKGSSKSEEEEVEPETGEGPSVYSLIPLAIPFLMGRGEKDKKKTYPPRPETPSYLPPGLGR